jgi:hypothetical protein
MGATLIPTQPHAAAAEPLTERAVLLRTIDAMAGAVKTGKGGPLLVVIMIALLSGLLASAAVWALHDVLGNRTLIDRIERIEDAQDAADDHNAWVVLALVALSEGKPLPPPPYRPSRRPAP